MIQQTVIAIAAGLILASPALAAPETLACTSAQWLNWRAESPRLDTFARDEELGGPIIHLDPQSGEWFREVPGSAALVVGGGTFEIVRTSDFSAYYDEWVGIDHDTMLRIWGGSEAPLRFVLVGHDDGLVMGACLEPDETFIFLREPDA